jgi:hypothetical protein
LREPCLRREADRCIGCAKTAIAAAPLDDFEKEAIFEGARIDLQVFGAAIALVENIVLLEFGDAFG